MIDIIFKKFLLSNLCVQHGAGLTTPRVSFSTNWVSQAAQPTVVCVYVLGCAINIFLTMVIAKAWKRKHIKGLYCCYFPLYPQLLSVLKVFLFKIEKRQQVIFQREEEEWRYCHAVNMVLSHLWCLCGSARWCWGWGSPDLRVGDSQPFTTQGSTHQCALSLVCNLLHCIRVGTICTC